MNLTQIALLLAGFVLLLGGAEMLVRGASRLAVAFGISPLVVGLTVVAFGTSAPEIAVSVRSAILGQGDLAFGNVVGSNIFNILFILGISAAITPLVVSAQLVRIDVPVMIAASLLVAPFGWDDHIGRVEGAILLAAMITYIVVLLRLSRKFKAADLAAVPDLPKGKGRWWVNLLLVLIGLALLVQGSRWLVDGAVAIAQTLGVSELVIGLTIVAAGTSLPEVATSIIAAVRGERDIAVGNVVGSCIFNVLAVLGIASVVAPNGMPVSPAAFRFDVPVMIAATIATLPIFFTGNLIARWEGFLFLSYYIAYTAFLILAAAEHAAAPVFSRVMLLFVIPLTAVTLLILAIRSLRGRRDAANADPRGH